MDTLTEGHEEKAEDRRDVRRSSIEPQRTEGRLLDNEPITFYPKTLKLEYEVILTKSFKDN